jgi:hypothetical protein
MAPWNGPEFAKKHNKTLDPKQAAQAAKVSTSILEEEGPGSEGKAIRIANAQAKKSGKDGKKEKDKKSPNRRPKGIRQADMPREPYRMGT